MAPTECKNQITRKNMALCFIELPRCLTERIPVFLAGILFSFSALPASASGTELAEQLFEEGSWITCMQESQRVLSTSPSNEIARLLDTTAALRSGKVHATNSLPTLIQLSNTAQQPGIRAQAANEAAWLLVRQNRVQEAWPLAEQAFLAAPQTPVFLSSGALLLHVMTQHTPLVSPSDTIRLQLQSCARLLRDVPPPPIGPSPLKPAPLLSRPGQWGVAFYRGAIRPAIGARCSLQPHCSEYFMEAGRAHPTLALPMIADRLVREPSVVNSGKSAIVRENGIIVYKDPLSNHDFWMTPHP
jgi:putative component of membrane protein insertase Oxa1/YidC/SpoIIIJ protein YidD